MSSDGLGNLSLRHNGILVDTKAIPTNTEFLVDNIGYPYTAKSASSFSWRGYLDDIRIYENRMLQEEEVQSLVDFGNSTKYPSDSLVALYTFNDGNAATAYDYTGNGNNGSIVGAAITSSIIGKALQFDGVDDYVITDIKHQMYTEDWSYVIIFTPQDLSKDLILIEKGSDSNEGRTILGTDSNRRLTTYIGGDGEILSPINILTENQQSHVVITFNSSTNELNVYHNNTLVITCNPIFDSASYQSNPQPIILGIESDFTSANAWSGSIQEFRYYNRVLTSDEQSALYNNRYGIKLKTGDETNHGFLVGDLIRAQRFTGNGVYQSDAVVTHVKGPKEFYVEPLNLANPSLELPQKGFEYVGVGNIYDDTRQGSVLLASEGVSAPYVDVIDGVTSFAK